VIDIFNQSFNAFFSADRFGLFVFYLLLQDNAAESSQNIPAYSDENQVLQNSFEIDNVSDEPVSRMTYRYRYMWSIDQYYRQPDDNLPEEEALLGREVRGSVNLKYVQDDYTAASVAAIRHQYMRERVQRVRFALPPEYFASEVNSHLNLTHWQGIDSTGAGYVGQRVRITGLRYSFAPSSMAVSVVGVKIPEPVAVVIPTFVPVANFYLIGPAMGVGF
jgi:hypothetical protein